jgi:hypothetical protein
MPGRSGEKSRLDDGTEQFQADLLTSVRRMNAREPARITRVPVSLEVSGGPKNLADQGSAMGSQLDPHHDAGIPRSTL